MSLILPNETRLTGLRVNENGQTIIDAAVCKRIEWLTSKCLVRLGNSIRNSGWETLYVDPQDGRYWVRSYQMSEMHGGGVPLLECVDASRAKDELVWDFVTKNNVPLKSFENRLIGIKIFDRMGGKLVGVDETYERIDWLISHYLKEIAKSETEETIEWLYVDLNDNRYWIKVLSKTNPEKQIELICISSVEAAKRFHI